jgi:hypothetical protein
MVSRTSQWSLLASITASEASTAAASPSVLSSQVPMSSSLVRRLRIASSSWRHIASGHQAAPAASMSAMPAGCVPVGALTVIVAVRLLRSIWISTCE